MAKQFFLQSCFLCITETYLLMTGKGFSIFDEFAARFVRLFPHEEGSTSSS